MIFFIIYLVLASIVAFIMYGKDKKKAIKKEWRIKEKTLLLTSFVGGAFGGLAGMLVFRHKTKAEHWYFWAVNIVGICWQVAVAIVLLVFVGFGIPF